MYCLPALCCVCARLYGRGLRLFVAPQINQTSSSEREDTVVWPLVCQPSYNICGQFGYVLQWMDMKKEDNILMSNNPPVPTCGNQKPTNLKQDSGGLCSTLLYRAFVIFSQRDFVL